MEEVTNEWTLEQITIKLKLITSINQGLKLNISDYSVVGKDSLWGAIKRYFKGEDFKKTINFLNLVYKNTLSTLDKLDEKDHDKILNLICDAFRSFDGLNAMKITYEGNIYFICSIDSLIQSTIISLRGYMQKNRLGQDYMSILEQYDTFKNIVVFPYNNKNNETKQSS